MKKQKAVFVVGPTASGKTALGIEIAKKFGGEVISADSMQIYKGVHIASAAPDESERQGIPHHLIEFLDTDMQFSVADYVKLAKEKIREIAGSGKLPIIVGGTGLYISSLLNNTAFIDEQTDGALREELEKKFDNIGGEEMLRLLAEFDGHTANRLHPNDRRRIIRAFEVYITTGKTITEQNENSHLCESEIEPLIIGINYANRELLYDRINKRVDIMLQNGLLDEAKTVFDKKSKKGGFQAIGHKELFGFLEGRISYDEAVEVLKMQTRRYAKRQLTWFRKDERIDWIYADECDNPVWAAISKVEKFVKE